MMRQSSYIRYWDRLRTDVVGCDQLIASMSSLERSWWQRIQGKGPDQASPPIGVVHVHQRSCKTD